MLRTRTRRNQQVEPVQPIKKIHRPKYARPNPFMISASSRPSVSEISSGIPPKGLDMIQPAHSITDLRLKAELTHFSPRKGSKVKIARYEKLQGFHNVFSPSTDDLKKEPFILSGWWNKHYFRNNNPIVLEIGCGKGEYTTSLAARYPDKNFIGVEVKADRLYIGARHALRYDLNNVAFLRQQANFLSRCFAPNEISEIWLTFSEPKVDNPTARITSPSYMEEYRQVLCDNGIIHIKTDHNGMFNDIVEMVHAVDASFVGPIYYNLYNDTHESINNDIWNDKLLWSKRITDALAPYIPHDQQHHVHTRISPYPHHNDTQRSNDPRHNSHNPRGSHSGMSTVEKEKKSTNDSSSEISFLSSSALRPPDSATPQDLSVYNDEHHINDLMFIHNLSYNNILHMKTHYENVWRNKGSNIHYCSFTLPSHNNIIDKYNQYIKKKRDMLNIEYPGLWDHDDDKDDKDDDGKDNKNDNKDENNNNNNNNINDTNTLC